MKHALSASAIYSSSDEDDMAKEPPAKKQRTKKAPKDKEREKERAGGEPSPGPQKPAPHRKTYNWLAPSAVGTSHHGPEGRSDRALSAVSASSPMVETESKRGSDADSARGSVPPEAKKKSRRKAPTGDAGPGKNWRKGMRKYVSTKGVADAT